MPPQCPEPLPEEDQTGPTLEQPQISAEPSDIAMGLPAPVHISETPRNDARVAQTEATGRERRDPATQCHPKPGLLPGPTTVVGCVAEEFSNPSEEDDTVSASSSSTRIPSNLNFLVLGGAANELNGTLI